MKGHEKIEAGWYCDGCGNTETLYELRQRSKWAIACCPERKLVPPALSDAAKHGIKVEGEA